MSETLGKYIIDDFIAEGGMARILRAKKEGIGGVEKVVAIKCLKGKLQEDDNYVKMLVDEARITTKMTHKNICHVYDLEHEDDKYFMVMEYIDGTTLADLSQYLFNKNRVFPIEAAVFIAKEVCDGLSYAHSMTDSNGEPLGIVHRDVNPQNICISRDGEVKLIDFGIAKADTSSETQSGTIKGKFNYMSPEQARGDRVDQRTDVFALGAVLYEMLCGHMLYPLSLDDMKLRSKTRMADFVPIESYLPDIPDKLRKIIAKALTRDINQRFATSRDFFIALTQFSHDACKVYDSLNLSILVEKYLKHLGKTEANPKVDRDSFTTIPKINVVKEKTEINKPSFQMDSSDTAVLTAAEAKELAGEGVTDLEESATSVYSKADFDAAVQAGLASDDPESAKLAASVYDDSVMSRSVDLDIVEPGKGSTVMVALSDVDLAQNNDGPIHRLISKLLSLEEKTLFTIAIILACVLILAIILFVAVRSDDDPEEDIPEVNALSDVTTISYTHTTA